MSMFTNETPDDERWRDLIAAADPMRAIETSGALSDTMFTAALQRLEVRCAETFAASETSASETNTILIVEQRRAATEATTNRRKWARTIVLITSSTLLVILGVFGALRWLTIRPSGSYQPPIAENQRPSEGFDSSADQVIDPANLAEGSQAPAANLVESTSPAINRSREKIQTVQEMLALSPSQLVRVQRRLDRVALDNELQAWLKQWNEGSPDQRSELEKQWVANRGFWSNWTLQGLREWDDPGVLQAAIEVLWLELGPKATETLAFCYDRPETRNLIVPYLLPFASETQLVAWLETTDQSELALRLITELARRPGAAATTALSALASDQVCSQLLKQLPWNAAHIARAFNALQTSNPEQQFRAAMLLTVIENPEVDSLLWQKVQTGVQTLPTLAILLLRSESTSETLTTKLQQSSTLMANLPSAQQRAQRWRRQQRSDTPTPDSFRKVCELCVTPT